jgi:hypothetical protein
METMVEAEKQKRWSVRKKRKKKRKKWGKERVFIFSQWLKDRKELGSATSFDKKGSCDTWEGRGFLPGCALWY